MAKLPVVELQLPPSARKVFLPQVRGVGQRIENAAVPQIKLALRDFLTEVVRDSYIDSHLKTRTGRTLRLLYDGIAVTGTRFDSILAGIYAPEYIVALEYGATVKPRRAKALTIPLPAALRADGTPKYRSANSYKRMGSYIWKSHRDGRAYIVRNLGDGTREFLYRLMDEVKLKERLGLRRHINLGMPELAYTIAQIIAQQMDANDILSVFDEQLAKRKVTGRRGGAFLRRTFRPGVV